jgi:hypothetical protein
VSLARSAAALVFTCAVTLASSARADGKLDRTRDEIRDDDGGDGRDRSDCDDDDDSWVGDAIGGFFSALFDDDDETDSSAREDRPTYTPADPPGFGYSRYPYERPDTNYLVLPDRQLAYAPGPVRSDVSPVLGPVHARPLAGQLALDGGYLDGVSRAGFSARFLTSTQLELDARAGWLHESASSTADALHGDAHLGLRFLQTEAVLLRAALGVRFWSDAELDAAGLDALLGLDVFPVRPLVVSAQFGGGNLGQALVGNARLQLGVALQRVELLAGIEWLQIGDVDLSSPILGVRLWL